MNSSRSIKAYYKGKKKRRGQKTRPIDNHPEKRHPVQVNLKPDWMKDMNIIKGATLDERLSMISAIGESLSINEDVLLALSVDVYKALLNFLLRAFAHEKERLDSQSLGARQE